MTRVALLTPSITTGDAVSNDVLGMYAVLKELGHRTRIFAEGWSFDNPRIWPAPEINRFLRDPSDLLIYHYSRGWDFGVKLLSERKWRTAIKYHNVTPPEFFVDFSKDFARMCQDGRNQLPFIASVGCDVYMSASAYNESELLQWGTPESRSFVVPPFHHTARLKEVQTDPQILKSYDDGKTNILMVGRVAPNKNHSALIEAFAAYYHDYNSDSRLFIVGKEESRLTTYNQWLRKVAAHLKVDHAVVFAGEVSDEELKAYYSLADVFMITSEHEGFCVPLVEAMSMKIPIVAYATSAIPGTVKDAGLVWKEKNPYLMAESVNSIVKGADVSKSLGERGWRRYDQNFTNEKIRSKFLTALSGLL
ncbi:MAG TPA: glycosyltransferase family 4 protein [Pyrinomonadaceae bacterium]|nr:glycosyltransferase family 4 protein [Pyrinomonadaceae bacterium]